MADLQYLLTSFHIYCFFCDSSQSHISSRRVHAVRDYTDISLLLVIATSKRITIQNCTDFSEQEVILLFALVIEWKILLYTAHERILKSKKMPAVRDVFKGTDELLQTLNSQTFPRSKG